MWWPGRRARVVFLVQQNLQRVVGVAAVGAAKNGHSELTGRFLLVLDHLFRGYLSFPARASPSPFVLDKIDVAQPAPAIAVAHVFVGGSLCNDGRPMMFPYAASGPPFHTS